MSACALRAVAVALAAAALLPSGAAAAGRDYVKLVDPWIEADRGRFFFFQSAGNPFGLVKLRPDTSTASGAPTGYTSDANEVKGFSHLHDWRLAGVQVMPTSGKPVPKTQGEKGWQSHVEHDASEVAEPGYHRVHLDRYGIDAELTSTDRVGMHRYTFRRSGPAEVIVNLAGRLGQATMKDARVERAGDRRLTGWVRQSTDGYVSHDTKLFFDVRFDRPFEALRGWTGGHYAGGGRPVDEVAGDQAGAFVSFGDLAAGEVVRMKVGLSLVDADGASRNVDAELPGWDFDAVKRASQQRWNAMLGRIDVRGGTPKRRVKFYTDLFHVLVGRGRVSDADGRYLDDTWNANRIGQIPLGGDGEPEFGMFQYDALWLTQWNVNSILGLAYPDVYSDFVNSQLQMYRDGGMLPRGPVSGNDSLVMTGSPVTSFITGAWNKGIRDFDPQLAYEAMADAHAVGGLFDKAAFEYDGWGGTGGARDYLRRGYVPYELANGPLAGGAGMTLEYANQDWALAQFARRLGEKGLNVAQLARASASSQADGSTFAAARAIDGRPARNGPAEWASAGETQPWIQLDWDEPQRLTRVALSDRLGAADANAGLLTFSDGSSVEVSGIPADGARKVVEFAPREATWVRFTVTGGSGPNVGLGELEAYDDRDMGDYLEQRSRNWRNVFDPSTGFVRPKSAAGAWMEPFDPLSPEDFVEANSWQATWFASHDVMGLANAMGGEETFASKLDFAFRSAEPAGFIGDYGDGYVSYGNQPGLQVAHLFNYVGRPWLTQHWVREVSEHVYGATTTTDGYGHHDEDQGQMGAMSALMAIGLFEVTGGSLERPVYDITSPVFDEVRIALDGDYYGGREFRIVTHGADARNQYIQRAKLDGEELRNAWFRHEALADGGTLELWLGSKPNEGWGVDELPPSASASEHKRAVHAGTIEIEGPGTVEVPYEAVDYHAIFSPDDTSLEQAYWTVTEPDGSPTDKARISNAGRLTVGDDDGTVRITATAADEGRASASRLVELDLDPARMRSNAARWPDAVATASSEFSAAFAADRIRDGFGREASDWASKGQQNPWIELRWDEPVRADRVVLYDRTSADDANGGTLTFSDGSSVPVTGIPKDGRAHEVTFPMKEFDSVRFQVAGGTGPNVGLLELEVFGAPRAPQRPQRIDVERGAGEATVTWTPPAFDGGAPVTGYVVRTYRDGALAAEAETGEDARSKTVPAQDGDVFTVAARNLAGTGPERGEPVFATRIDVIGPDTIVEPDARVAYRAEHTPAETTYKDVTWTVAEPDGSPTEVAEIGEDGVLRVNHRSGQVLVTATNADGGPEVKGSKLVTVEIDQAAIRENAALRPGVTATASSVFSAAFGAARVHDGFGAGSGDWASAGQQDPWVQLDFPDRVSADRIVLYDRTSRDDANAGTLTFSDGTTVPVAGIPANGDPRTVEFPMRDFDWVRFQVTGGTGPNVGLLELEVLARPDWIDTTQRQGESAQ